MEPLSQKAINYLWKKRKEKGNRNNTNYEKHMIICKYDKINTYKIDNDNTGSFKSFSASVIFEVINEVAVSPSSQVQIPVEIKILGDSSYLC